LREVWSWEGEENRSTRVSPTLRDSVPPTSCCTVLANARDAR
jgi:hypothetical protein